MKTKNTPTHPRLILSEFGSFSSPDNLEPLHLKSLIEGKATEKNVSGIGHGQIGHGQIRHGQIGHGQRAPYLQVSDGEFTFEVSVIRQELDPVEEWVFWLEEGKETIIVEWIRFSVGCFDSPSR